MLAAAPITLPGQTFTTLYSFCAQGGCPDGYQPNEALTQGTNGNLYSTTPSGGPGADVYGTVFEVTPGGAVTTLQGFDGTDGSRPYAGLLQAANGDFYGTTLSGGAKGYGTIFKITPAGALTTLYSFCAEGGGGCTDGVEPTAGLVQAPNGDFYGTTSFGGSKGGGTVFKITPAGTLTTLYTFCTVVGCTDGAQPNAGLVQANNGDFYGTTAGGGSAEAGQGTVFKISPSGVLTTLHSFAGYPTDGGAPVAALVQASNGVLYGTTELGGTNCGSTYGCGTVFKITPNGETTTLYSFCPQTGCADGSTPESALVQASDGAFYGTTPFGGTAGSGTIFKITTSGELTTLYTFLCSGCVSGAGDEPFAGLVQATNGVFYGTTASGGIYSHGSIFSLSVGLGSFVETQTTSGKVGVAVKVLGTDLIGATSVTFNGTAALFKVVSSSEITATVPTGATTGTVQVVTPNGTLSSNVPFRIP
jgi:uncharacterized repeat protein (TIGR03803 family)